MANAPEIAGSFDADEIAAMLEERAARARRVIPRVVPYERVEAALYANAQRVRCQNTSDQHLKAQVWCGRGGYQFIEVAFGPFETREICSELAAGFRQIHNGTIVGGAAPQIAFDTDEANGILRHGALTPTEKQLQEERARSRALRATPSKLVPAPATTTTEDAKG